MTTELEAPITGVTVYPDRARVTRRGTATLGVGEHRLQVSNLPLTLQPDSVRAGGRGTARARLLGVDVSTTYYAEPAPRNVAELQVEIEAKEDRDKALADEEASLSAQMELRRGLGAGAGAHRAKGISVVRAEAAVGEAVRAFMATRMAEFSRGQRGLNVERRRRGREIKRLQKELEALNVRRPTERFAVTAEVEVLEAGDFTLDVTYVAGTARWQPLYDVRVSEGEEPTVTLAYLGEVSHNSGEDWEEVALTLSTAKPALATVLPELHPWYLRVFVPEPVRKRRAAMPPVAARAPAPETVGAVPMMEMAEEPKPQAPPDHEVEVLEAQVDETGAAVAFRVAKPVTIAGDGSPRKTTVAIVNLKPRLDYVAAPRLVQQAYRRARVANDSEYTFLPGRANIFYEDEFVGSTTLGAKKPGLPLQTIAPSQEFELFLGADDRVKVERELVARDVDKKLIGNTRRLHFAYRITVQNLCDRTERIVIADQIPVARREEIKVKLDLAEPKPDELTELGLLRWELELEPKREQNIRFGFVIEHPRDLTITGLPHE